MKKKNANSLDLGKYDEWKTFHKIKPTKDYPETHWQNIHAGECRMLSGLKKKRR